MPEETEADEEEQDQPLPTSPLDDAEWLEDQYNSGGEDGEGLTQAAIGRLPEVVDHHGREVTSSTVSHYMKKHGIETRANFADDERLEDPDWLEDAYWGDLLVEDGATMQQIADEIGCSDGTVMRRLHEYEIDVRRSTVGEPAEDDEEQDEPDDEEQDAGE